MNWKVFCKEFCKKSWKKIILGTSDTWLAIRLSHRPSNPEYYFVNWRIFWQLHWSKRDHEYYQNNQHVSSVQNCILVKIPNQKFTSWSDSFAHLATAIITEKMSTYQCTNHHESLSHLFLFSKCKILHLMNNSRIFILLHSCTNTMYL